MEQSLSAFETYLRSGRRAASGRIEHKFNPNHDPSNGQFTFGPGGGSVGGGSAGSRSAPRSSTGGGGSGRGGQSGGGPRLTPEAREIADRIGNDFYLRTGKQIKINSGTRSPERQAGAMLEKLGDWGIYKDQKGIGEIRGAYLRSKNAGGGRDQQVAAMANVSVTR